MKKIQIALISPLQVKQCDRDLCNDEVKKRAEIEEEKFAGTGIILFGSGYVLKYFTK